eukprot:Hpha_TRINITY_DN16944_c0_g3::TRINITY_DN16944_c0_g3_i1::g.54027::m.54027
MQNTEYPLRTETLEYVDWIPVRLKFPERSRQRLVRAGVAATSYTDAVDDAKLDPKKRSQKMVKELYHFFLGMYVAESDPEDGVGMCEEKDLSKAEASICDAFELARRYKIMNPEIMRTEYGKLLYMMQDAMSEEAVHALGFRPLKPIVTVRERAKELGVEGLLSHPNLPLATTPVPRLQPISALNMALRKKDRVVKELIREFTGGYGHGGKREDEVERVIRSIDDCNCYMQDNVDTIIAMIEELVKNFNPDRPEPGFELTIHEGDEGSRLEHNHQMQFDYVRQSLLLWKNILRDMYRLWLLMEQDLLDHTQPYKFTDTGQGHNRVQQPKRLYLAMEEVLRRTQKEVGSWIGSERIHMGDHQVPNGFNFIDKYTNVARIINPILRTLQQVDNIVKDPEHSLYIREVWGDKERLKKTILCDFFRHGFDGSGGNNDMDAGSCIDGRLTSAWQWCSLLKTKPYYPIFLLSGFSSFDGDFE